MYNTRLCNMIYLWSRTGAWYSIVLEKMIYCNHRHWLQDLQHPYRSMINDFDGITKYKPKPSQVIA